MASISPTTLASSTSFSIPAITSTDSRLPMSSTITTTTSSPPMTQTADLTWIDPPAAPVGPFPPATIENYGPVYQNDVLLLEWQPPIGNASFEFICNIPGNIEPTVLSFVTAASGDTLAFIVAVTSLVNGRETVCWLSFLGNGPGLETVGFDFLPINRSEASSSTYTWSTPPTTTTLSSTSLLTSRNTNATTESPSTTSIIATSTSSPFTAISNPASTPSAAATQASSPSTLSAGAKAGIAVGVTVFALACAALIGLLLWRRRRRGSHANNAPGDPFQYEGKPELPGDMTHATHEVPAAPGNAAEWSPPLSSPVFEMDDPARSRISEIGLSK